MYNVYGHRGSHNAVNVLLFSGTVQPTSSILSMSRPGDVTCSLSFPPCCVLFSSFKCITASPAGDV